MLSDAKLCGQALRSSKAWLEVLHSCLDKSWLVWQVPEKGKKTIEGTLGRARKAQPVERFGKPFVLRGFWTSQNLHHFTRCLGSGSRVAVSSSIFETPAPHSLMHILMIINCHWTDVQEMGTLRRERFWFFSAADCVLFPSSHPLSPLRGGERRTGTQHSAFSQTAV